MPFGAFVLMRGAGHKPCSKGGDNMNAQRRKTIREIMSKLEELDGARLMLVDMLMEEIRRSY